MTDDDLKKRLDGIDPSQFQVNTEAMVAYLLWKATGENLSDQEDPGEANP